MWPIVFCIAAIISYVESESNNVDKIVGGHDIEIEDAPYQAALLANKSALCGGVIVASDIALTAAHCFNRSLVLRYAIRVGSSHYARGGQVISVDDYVIHPSYTKQSKDYDVTVLHLAEKLKFTNKIKSIPMKNEGDVIPDGDMTTVTGWGATKEKGPAATTLQEVKVPKVNAQTCQTYYIRSKIITNRMFCAGYAEGKKDACQGDSGGPLVHKKKLAGLVSFGRGCARRNYPGVYAKVSALRKWIDKQIADLRAGRNRKNKGHYY